MSEDEARYWRCLIEALQGVMTIAQIAEAIEAEDRQVWRFKAGERVPRGIQAVRLHLLHVKTCPDRQCPIGHVASVSVGTK